MYDFSDFERALNAMGWISKRRQRERFMDTRVAISVYQSRNTTRTRFAKGMSMVMSRSCRLTVAAACIDMHSMLDKVKHSI